MATNFTEIIKNQSVLSNKQKINIIIQLSIPTILSRYPQEFPTLLRQYKVENKMTFADRIERVGTLLQMLDMLL